MNAYDELVESRKRCRICVQRDPGKIRNGNEFPFDRPVVSYWSQWLGHQTPTILIVGQDFGDVEYFIRHQGLDERDNITNANLRKLLKVAGLNVGEAPDRDDSAPVFLTNSILCLKAGQMNAPIKPAWVDACAQKHLYPLTNHLNAPIVVAMGANAWRAVRRVFSLPEAPTAIKSAAGSSWDIPRGTSVTRVFAVVHCSGLGIGNRSWPQQVSDWCKIGETVREFHNHLPQSRR